MRKTVNIHLERFIDDLVKTYRNLDYLSRPELAEVRDSTSNTKGFAAFLNEPEFKVRHGVYSIKEYVDLFLKSEPVSFESVVELAKPILPVKEVNPTQVQAQIYQHVAACNLVPEKHPEFVAFGDFNLIKNFIKSGKFFPIYITGESGNGKTLMVYQACAVADRELIRANITDSTDEDDLLGGYRLLNGETVWQDGPAIDAMKRGAVLLLDEINLASPKIMCLQPIMEGNAVYVKKTNTLVYPAPGFTVIATANTKGKESSDGRYIGSNTLNEALLDRFACTIEHEYPANAVEAKILINILEKNNASNSDTIDFCNRLVAWADTIRKTYNAGGVDEMISTRRLIHIINFFTFGIQDRMKAIEYCIARFDDDTKSSFTALYRKIDESIDIPQSHMTAQV